MTDPTEYPNHKIDLPGRLSSTKKVVELSKILEKEDRVSQDS